MVISGWPISPVLHGPGDFFAAADQHCHPLSLEYIKDKARRLDRRCCGTVIYRIDVRRVRSLRTKFA